VDVVQVRPGAYHDSVTLMQVSRVLGTRDGVQVAQVAMATDLNLGLLAGLGFAVPERTGSADLLIAVRAESEDVLAAALAAVDPVLAASPRPAASGSAIGAQPPRTVGLAARGLEPGEAGLAMISVPGQHAFTEAMDAVDVGLNVMVFSDNVPLEHEIRLKEAAQRRGTLVLGPDCGTAVIGGVGLGFANVARPGPVGIVAASGTGAAADLLAGRGWGGAEPLSGGGWA
jgi:FdrA protein